MKIIPDSRIRNIVSKGPKYRCPFHIDFNRCREEIASAWNNFGNRWCKRESVECNALKEWKLSIFNIVNKVIKFFRYRGPFLDLHLSISNGFVSSKIDNKRDKFNFDTVNFSSLHGDVPRRPSYGVYISQLIRFANVCSHVEDFNASNKCLTVKLLKQGYRYHKLRKDFSKFYRRHYELISKFNVRFYIKAYRNQNFMVTKYTNSKRLWVGLIFLTSFKKKKTPHICYDLNAMRPPACLVINPMTVDNFAALFNCTPVDRASVSMMAPP